ncbi:hypothetical protein BRW65_04390 [Mycobacterium paraffinicum]|uniref:Uncharacterized protein n=1 Tax=Mycobacterium paraffinicum TaxID=53378 RepID=A0A1Q4I1B7_9MYCO|nr:hypothetical protein [Mycobacterium paraffinicum]OJZ75772.1 hypothetical protein BRW65_04390 [Mycobacterium paraffinicum]
MSTTTDVVDTRSRWGSYRRHGFFFRPAAMLTISLGFALHLYRVLFGDALTLQHAATLTNDRLLLVPMTYAGITGILVWRHVRYANKRHRALFTASVVYIAGSVPLHIYLDYVIKDLTFVSWFPMWFSYLLLIVVYPAFLTMFWRLRFQN